MSTGDRVTKNSHAPLTEVLGHAGKAAELENDANAEMFSLSLSLRLSWGGEISVCNFLLQPAATGIRPASLRKRGGSSAESLPNMHQSSARMRAAHFDTPKTLSSFRRFGLQPGEAERSKLLRQQSATTEQPRQHTIAETVYNDTLSTWM